MTEAECALARRNLFCFSVALFRASGKQWVRNWHQEVICRALGRVAAGLTRRLIINIPPRYSKTELAVVNFIAWSMGNFPDSEFIHASYSKRLATNNAYHTRALMMSEAYQAVFPDVKLKDDSKAKDEFRTEQGGIVYATGAEGTITGYGAGKVRGGFGGAVIIDDPTKAGEAMSDVKRQNVIDWYQSTVESRCNSPETPIIVIMQRLHEDDLSGWLLHGGTGENWDHLCIPAINDDGEPLWPAKHDLHALQRMESADPYNFSGQYMQTPTPKGGGMFKTEWITRYREAPVERDIVRIVQSWDTAYKAAQINDPSACTTWAETKDGYYLLHAFVKRMEYPELKRMAKTLADEWKPDALLIEDKASGQSLIQELRGETRHSVIAIHPENDKETRANAVTSMFEAGRVIFPYDAPWLDSIESELSTFPLGRHDDQVDSVTQALKYMHDRTAALPIAIYANHQAINRNTGGLRHGFI